MQISNRPEWRTVVGGSKEYIKSLVKDYHHKIKINSAVKQVWSDTDRAYVEDNNNNIFIKGPTTVELIYQKLKFILNNKRATDE